MDVNDLPAPFVARIDAATGCWRWTGWIDSYGYGRLHGYDAPILAHRCVYEILVGPIPDGLTLDHLCGVKECVNPAHLEPVTHAENIRRATAARTHCPNGHPYDDTNTYLRPGRGRVCRVCARARQARHRAKLAA